MNHYDILIVGAGHGGAQAAIALRQGGFAGSVALLGDEPDPPYQRPPLSKEYLAGEKPFDQLLIRPAAFWAEREVALLLGKRVVAVDAEAHSVTTAEGETIGYGQLIWAAGGTPRRLPCPGGDLPGVHGVRTRADIDRILTELPAVETVAVIGGGYIGLEAAAVLAKLGKRVVLVEALDRVLARVAGPAISRFFAEEHRAHDVDLRLGTAVEAIEGADRATGVRLAGGEVIACQLVVVGIGIVPEVGPLLAAGAEGGDGIDIDAHGRTSLPDVFALGDCARHANRHAATGVRLRLESVQNANDQATVIARNLLGQEVEYDAAPWFWSNQYDLRLQTIGLSIGHDQEVVRGDPAGRSFSVVYLRQGRVIALDCVNLTRDYAQGKRLVVEGISPDLARLADAAVPLKEMA